MRHQNKRGRLSRNISSRKALLKIMANNLIMHQRMETTIAKAKALKVFIEPIITLAKNNPDSVAAKRLAYKKLCDRKNVKFLFDELAPLYKDIPGGYTRILQSGIRKGDGAQLVMMELVKRTISDDKLLGLEKKALIKEKGKKRKEKELEAQSQEGANEGQTKKAKGKKSGTEKASDEKHAAPDVSVTKKEERIGADVRKEKAKKEQKKVQQKGFLKRFRRKSMDS
jgi:large subunit ribosomal protein L17